MPEDLFTREFKDFNASTVALKGSNLIEASAGTGKTYSIAILVLRMVIEQKIPIQNILMVTFTKAAVAELAAAILRAEQKREYHIVQPARCLCGRVRQYRPNQ